MTIRRAPSVAALTQPAHANHDFVLANWQAWPPRLRSPEKGARPLVVARVASLVIVISLSLAGCASNGSATSVPARSSATTPPATQPPDPTTTAIEQVTGGATVELSTGTLPEPPAGFSADEVAAFAERAIDIVERGISPDVAPLSQSEAFAYVFANQPAESTNETRKAFEAVVSEGGYDYTWAVASLFEAPPTDPAKVLSARWQVDTSPGTTAAGNAEPILRVALSVAAQHNVPAGNADAGITAPVVVKRTVIVQGFRPLGGPNWRPAIGIQADLLFGGKCAPANGSILTPATRPATLKEDLRRFRKYFNTPDAVTVGATTKASDLTEFVNEYCEQ